jgi:hypothetical protein
MEPEDAVVILEKDLNKTRNIFNRYIAAIEEARRQYTDSALWCYDGIEDGLDAILQEYWNTL